MRGDETLASEFGGTFGARTPHALYSGTKSFWGPVALRAESDGLLELDETVASTVESWRDDPWKRRVTLRMLLALTAGFGFGGLGAAVPPYDRALAMTLKNEPGTTFTYGGIALQVFGAVLARKLASRGQTPHDYLRERILRDAGVEVAKWRTLSDGTHPLPTGAFLTAENWLAYGRYVLRERTSLGECFTGSAANARYGLGWWLAPPGAPVGSRLRKRLRAVRRSTSCRHSTSPSFASVKAPHTSTKRFSNASSAPRHPERSTAAPSHSPRRAGGRRRPAQWKRPSVRSLRRSSPNASHI